MDVVVIASTPCHSQSCAARLSLEFPIELFDHLDRAKAEHGWKKIKTEDGKDAWMCPRCSA